MRESTDTTPASKTPRSTIILRWVVAVVLLGALGLAGWYGAIYALSPEAIRKPAVTHYHLRLQVVANGKVVDFSEADFQTPQGSDICSGGLTKEPIHFHDGLDQFVHIHWTGMTGGLLLKHYGWNLVGGLPDTLGYHFKSPLKFTAVPIHGSELPQPASDARYYVYTGDAAQYHERSWNDFLGQELTTFLADRADKTTWLDRLIPAARAHGDEPHEVKTGAHLDDPALVKLNDLKGNVVIFAQKNRPTEAQIKSRFSSLVPLPESSCAG
jgi:hypothetical protein